jgi:hypothetical protein
MSATKGTQEASKKTTGEASKGFTAEEKSAMRERARELKAEARMDRNRAEGEKALFEKIAEMEGADHAVAEKLHEERNLQLCGVSGQCGGGRCDGTSWSRRRRSPG